CSIPRSGSAWSLPSRKRPPRPIDGFGTTDESSSSKRDLLEDPPWHQAYDQHDTAPEGWDIGNVGALDDGAMNPPSGRFRLGPKQALLKIGRHGRIDEPWPDRRNTNPHLVESLSETLEEGVDGCLGRSIDVIARPSAICRDRGDDCDTAVPRLLLHFRKPGQQRHGANGIGAELLDHQLGRSLAARLVRQRAMGDQHDVEPAEGLLGLCQ